MGDREQMLSCARNAIAEIQGIRILAASSVLDNPPLLYEDQPPFLNQALELEVDAHISPHALLRKLKEIEKKLGRIPRFRYGPREIDLDILSYGEVSIQGGDLTLPHHALGKRSYLESLLHELQSSAKQLQDKAISRSYLLNPCKKNDCNVEVIWRL